MEVAIRGKRSSSTSLDCDMVLRRYNPQSLTRKLKCQSVEIWSDPDFVNRNAAHRR